MRYAVNGLDNTSDAIFGAMRWGIDRLERRDEMRKLQAPIVVAVEHGAQPPRDEIGDETMIDSFPASDPPAGWAGPPVA